MGALTVRLLSLAALLIRQRAAPAAPSQKKTNNRPCPIKEKKKKTFCTLCKKEQRWKFQTGPCFITLFLILPPPAVKIELPLCRLVIKIRLFHRAPLCYFFFFFLFSVAVLRWSVDAESCKTVITAEQAIKGSEKKREGRGGDITQLF